MYKRTSSGLWRVANNFVRWLDAVFLAEKLYYYNVMTE